MNSNLSAPPVVVLIGGNGSNLQALIDKGIKGHPIHIVGVISHRPDAYGLIRAQNAGIPTQVISHLDYDKSAAFEAALLAAISTYTPTLIVLAGFMRVLSAAFVRHFPGKILNIHPSLLPKYKGLHTHERVLAAQELEHGISVHFVTEELDGGPIIAQVKVPVLPDDNLDSLRERAFAAEHWLYPQVVEWFTQNRLKCDENVVTLDNKRLGPQGLLLSKE
jgi:phosphoribosylglycinamide formyltransferase-1